MYKIANISILIGISYYILSPLLIGNLDCINSFPFIENYLDLTDGINVPVYLVYVFIFISIYYFYNRNNKLVQKNTINKNYIKISAIFFLIFIPLQAWAYYGLWPIIFQGYLGNENNELNEFKALICGINVVYSFFYNYYYMAGYKNYSRYFLIQLIFNSIILIGSGSRIYVLSAILVIFYTNYFCSQRIYIKYKFIKIILLSLGASFGILYIGLWRQNLDFDANSLCYYLFSEAYNIWLSGGYAINYGELNFFRFPYDFFVNLIGILPTIIFPFKFDLMSYFDNLINTNKNDLYSPLGGVSIIYTLINSFGIIGIFLVFIFISIIIRNIYIKSLNSAFYSSYYVVLCSIIPFIIFRESLFHIIKNTIFNAFLVPYIFLSINLWINFFTKSKSR